MKAVRRPPGSILVIGVLAPAAVVGCNLIVGIHGVTGPDAGGADGGGGSPSSSSSGTGPQTCPSGYKSCGGGLCESATDPENGCGDPTSCDPCPFANGVATCTNGACALAGCATGYDDCNGMASDGCEVHIANDTANCGKCGHACSSAGGSAMCAGGVCSSVACTGSDADCDNNPANGCEVDLDSNVMNCGVCTHVCGAVHTSVVSCTSGKCGFVCTAPYARCSTSIDDSLGCYIDTSGDSNNCGACDHVCGAVNGVGTCSKSACGFTCQSPYQHCSSASSDDPLGCNVNTSKDAQNCGTCGHSCGGGACQNGVCQPWTVTTTATAPLNLAINPGYVVWTELSTGGVYAVPITTVNGATAGKQLSNLTGNTASWDVVIDNNPNPARVYWTNRAEGSVYSNNITGSASSATKYFTDVYGAGTYGITFIGNTLWVNNIDHGGVSYYVAGALSTTFVVPPQGPTACAYYSGGITSYNGKSLVSDFGTGRLIYDGNPIGAGTNYGSRYVATDYNFTGGTYAYWTNEGDCGQPSDQSVWAMPIPGATSSTTPTVIASSEGAPNGIVADAKWSIYWANTTGTSSGIRHATSTNGTAWTVTTVAPGKPHDVEVNATTIFWTDANAIMAVAK